MDGDILECIVVVSDMVPEWRCSIMFEVDSSLGSVNEKEVVSEQSRFCHQVSIAGWYSFMFLPSQTIWSGTYLKEASRIKISSWCLVRPTYYDESAFSTINTYRNSLSCTCFWPTVIAVHEVSIATGRICLVSEHGYFDSSV